MKCGYEAKNGDSTKEKQMFLRERREECSCAKSTVDTGLYFHFLNNRVATAIKGQPWVSYGLVMG